WHADPAGDYDGSADGKYRGQTRTDADGAYRFETLVPGRYLNGAQFRPAHVHVKVWVDGVERLTTQLYFANDPYNDVDPWFDPDRIVADLDDGDLVVGGFDLVV
ncbi:MAG: dioxygenase, partial [Myxococcota bacterium]